MGWCSFGKRRSPRLNAIKHMYAERQILNSSLLLFRLGLRLTELSEALTLAILRLRLRMAGGCWPRCRGTRVESGAWH